MNRITRKEFLKRTIGGVSVAALVQSATGQAQKAGSARVSGPPLDLIVRNGKVVDGTGEPWFAGSIGIRGGKIVDIGKLPGATAKQTIDAGGQYVCPGFIDPHTHEEIMMIPDPVMEKFVRQGVTTLVNGNCGHSVSPGNSRKVLEYHWREALISRKRSLMPVEWNGLAGYARLMASRGGTTINSAVLLGYGTIRWVAMKGAHNRPPNNQEWKDIDRYVREGLEQGAVGVSTGLAYIPCSYATTDEIVRVAKILAEYDATYATHTRNSVQTDPTGGIEAIEIGEKGGCRVQISHFAGRFKGALDMVTEARRRGLQVAADVIPQSVSHRRASNRTVQALMVYWPGAFDMSEQELRQLLVKPDTRAEILKKVRHFNEDKTRVVIVRAETPKHKPNVGKSIAQLATELGRDPNDLYMEIVLDDQNPVVFTTDGNVREPRSGGDEAMARRFGKDNVLPEGYWTTHALFGPGSDSLPLDVEEPYGWYEHQRRGAFVGYMKQARANNVPLEVAVAKATSLPAQQFRLFDRGLISTGKAADLMVVDLDAYKFPSPAEDDPNNPFPVASGVSTVIVAGVPVLLEGKLTRAKPGRVLV